MKIKRVLVFSIVIASLTFVAIAYADEVEIGFTGQGQFGYYFDVVGGDFVMVFYPAVFIPPAPPEPPVPYEPPPWLPHVPDLLDVSSLGPSEVDWEIRVTATDFEDPATYLFHSGWFTITGPNGRDSLEGYYSDWIMNPESGDYDLEWAFTGGTGRFDDFVGIGHTDGLANLLTGQAWFTFYGTVTDDDDDQGEDE